MIVSHFELLFKPQSPAVPIGTAAVDKVIQGYFLEITNLEDRTYQYALDFTISPPGPGLGDRSLSGNTLVFVDTPPGTDNRQGVLNGASGASVFRPSTGNITVPALGTALVAVLPSAFPSMLDSTPLPLPTFEVRGFVSIRLPAVRGQSLFSREPQSLAPVKVLLTPQNRTTYFLANGTISDQTQASLPLGEGAAIYNLPPEPGRPGFSVGGLLDLERIRPFDLEVIEAARPELLASLLAEIDAEGSDVSAFNAALKRQAGPFALQKVDRDAKEAAPRSAPVHREPA